MLNDEFDLPIISQRNIIPSACKILSSQSFLYPPPKTPRNLCDVSPCYLVTLPATRYHITKSMLAQLGLIYRNRMVHFEIGQRITIGTSVIKILLRTLPVLCVKRLLTELT